MLSYINHPETDERKAHTDIMLNNEYIGYYIILDEVLTAFIEIEREMYAGEFQNIEQLEIKINEVLTY
jgi:hypothetical protein